MDANRKVNREKFAEYISPFMTSAQAVYDYQPADTQGQSPVVYLSSSGSERSRLTKAGFNRHFYINVHFLALYAEHRTESDPVYHEADAEDAIDNLDAQLESAMIEARVKPEWANVQYEGRSTADEPVLIGGDLYLHEIVTLKFGST